MVYGNQDQRRVLVYVFGSQLARRLRSGGGIPRNLISQSAIDASGCLDAPNDIPAGGHYNQIWEGDTGMEEPMWSPRGG